MRTKNLFFSVLFALGIITASFSTSYRTGTNDSSSLNWNSVNPPDTLFGDTTDSNPGGGIIPPVGH